MAANQEKLYFSDKVIFITILIETYMERAQGWSVALTSQKSRVQKFPRQKYSVFPGSQGL